MVFIQQSKDLLRTYRTLMVSGLVKKKK